MRRPFRQMRVWAVIALVAGPASPAVAQPSPQTDPDGVVEARAAFQEGIALANEDRWADALQALERSDAIRPHAITTYNVGYCDRQLGHPTLARKMFLKALADDRSHGGGELPASLLGETQSYLAEAETQIARVIVTIAPGAVSVDGRPLELIATGGARPVLLAGTRPAGEPEAPPAVSFEVQVDPGTHVFVLSSPGRPDVSANATLAPGSATALDLRPAPTETRVLAARPHPPFDMPSPTPSRPRSLPGFVALGVGGAALAAGTISGLLAFGTKDDVHAACSAGASADACVQQRAAGNRAADISTVSFIAGGVGVGIGAVWLLVAGGTSAGLAVAPTRSARIEPSIGPQTLGLQGSF